MLVFPNAKINIGLNIVEKRADGFHNIQSVFYPIKLSDALEIIVDHTHDAIKIETSGLAITGSVEENLIYKAYHLIKAQYVLPGLNVYLHKVIPMGAGLGGGSSDAAFFIKLLNDVADINLSYGEQHYFAKQLGSDCSFFINNKPAYATQKGEVLDSVLLDLSGKHIVLIKPDVFVSTPMAYAGVTPQKPASHLEEDVLLPVENWKGTIKNDFEPSVFEKFPVIGQIKERLYASGALYVAMSGSGSSVYGIFDKEINLQEQFSQHFYWSDYL